MHIVVSALITVWKCLSYEHRFLQLDSNSVIYCCIPYLAIRCRKLNIIPPRFPPCIWSCDVRLVVRRVHWFSLSRTPSLFFMMSFISSLLISNMPFLPDNQVYIQVHRSTNQYNNKIMTYTTSAWQTCYVNSMDCSTERKRKELPSDMLLTPCSYDGDGDV